MSNSPTLTYAERPSGPWLAFLNELDGLLPHSVALYCVGGFAVAEFYGTSRTTGDLDYIALMPSSMRSFLDAEAGEGSPLYKKHGLYLQSVDVILVQPLEYESRLIPAFAETWDKLRIFVLEAHDLILCKLERNSDIDRFDVQELGRKGLLSKGTLQQRYREEVRPALPEMKVKSTDLTIKLWLDLF